MTGWVALPVMLALAATSNDTAVRRWGAVRGGLQRTVYLAAAPTFGHWILTAFDPAAAYVHLGILAALEAIRHGLGYRAESPRR